MVIETEYGDGKKRPNSPIICLDYVHTTEDLIGYYDHRWIYAVPDVSNVEENIIVTDDVAMNTENQDKNIDTTS